MPTVTCYLGLGSNIETASSSRYDYLYSAVRQLAQFEAVTVVAASHVYETPPVGFDDQENFYNAVVKISTSLSPQELLTICLDIVEKRAGRIRTTENGPRTLDVDILLYGDESVDEEDLCVPHPRMRERAFVMVPLAEVAADLVGELSQYEFVDSIKKVKKIDMNFDDLIASYRER